MILQECIRNVVCLAAADAAATIIQQREHEVRTTDKLSRILACSDVVWMQMSKSLKLHDI
jgi:hypothetical protein